MAVPYFFDPIGEFHFIIPVDFQEYKGANLREDAESARYLAECAGDEFPEAGGDWYLAIVVDDSTASLFAKLEDNGHSLRFLDSDDPLFRAESIDILETKLREAIQDVDDIVAEQNELFGPAERHTDDTDF